MSKKLTTEEFIKRAKETHGDRYDYSKVEYRGIHIKVIIICNKHKDFKQTPANHLKGQNCPKCAIKTISEKLTKNTKYFIIKAKNIHNNKYDYSKVNYINACKKIIIKCKKHGLFKQTPNSHLSGNGCPKCGFERTSNLCRGNKEDFIKRSTKIHGNKYDYSSVIYKNNHTNVKIVCNTCKEGFLQLPINHLQGKGCYKCSLLLVAEANKKSYQEFLRQASEIHGDKYDYSKLEYRRIKDKVNICCEKHGEFQQRGANHLEGHGCPHCVLKSEGEVKDFLFKYFKDWQIIPNKKIWDKYKDYNHKRFCDFWLEKDNIKIMVEYDGEQHFKPICFNGIPIKQAEKGFKKTQLKDKLDFKFCRENNIILHRIKYNEDKEESIKMLLSRVS